MRTLPSKCSDEDIRSLVVEWWELIAAGKVKSRETVREGIDSAPEAFLDLFRGANTGKMLVRL